MGDFASIVNSLLTSFGMNFGEELIRMILFPLFYIIIVVFVLYAYNGYKLFRLSLGVNGALTFGLIGFFVTYLMFMGVQLPINIPALVGLVSGALGVVLMFYLFRISMAITGTAIGFVLGAFLVLPIMKSSGNWTRYMHMRKSWDIRVL